MDLAHKDKDVVLLSDARHNNDNNECMVSIIDIKSTMWIPIKWIVYRYMCLVVFVEYHTIQCLSVSSLQASHRLVYYILGHMAIGIPICSSTIVGHIMSLQRLITGNVHRKP